MSDLDCDLDSNDNVLIASCHGFGLKTLDTSVVRFFDVINKRDDFKLCTFGDLNKFWYVFSKDLENFKDLFINKIGFLKDDFCFTESNHYKVTLEGQLFAYQIKLQQYYAIATRIFESIVKYLKKIKKYYFFSSFKSVMIKLMKTFNQIYLNFKTIILLQKKIGTSDKELFIKLNDKMIELYRKTSEFYKNLKLYHNDIDKDIKPGILTGLTGEIYNVYYKNVYPNFLLSFENNDATDTLKNQLMIINKKTGKILKILEKEQIRQIIKKLIAKLGSKRNIVPENHLILSEIIKLFVDGKGEKRDAYGEIDLTDIIGNFNYKCRSFYIFCCKAYQDTIDLEQSIQFDQQMRNPEFQLNLSSVPGFTEQIDKHLRYSVRDDVFQDSPDLDKAKKKKIKIALNVNIADKTVKKMISDWDPENEKKKLMTLYRISTNDNTKEQIIEAIIADAEQEFNQQTYNEQRLMQHYEEYKFFIERELFNTPMRLVWKYSAIKKKLGIQDHEEEDEEEKEDEEEDEEEHEEPIYLALSSPKKLPTMAVPSPRTELQQSAISRSRSPTELQQSAISRSRSPKELPAAAPLPKPKKDIHSGGANKETTKQIYKCLIDYKNELINFNEEIKIITNNLQIKKGGKKTRKIKTKKTKKTKRKKPKRTKRKRR